MKSLENKIYDFIVNNELATNEEISLVTNINGYNAETLNNIVWCRSGYHDPEQCLACEPENFIDPNYDFLPDPEDEETETDEV